MAWTNIPNEDVAVGALPFARTVQALRDNVPAAMAGDVGAPRLQTNAIQDSAVTTIKLASGERMTTSNVLAQTAGASVGAVGTYALLETTAPVSLAPGATRAGSGLEYANAQGINSSGSPAGTWRVMGRVDSTGGDISLWLRIS